jgi:hypothetical protein
VQKQQESGGSQRAIHCCLAQFRRNLSQKVEKNSAKMGIHEIPKSRTMSFTRLRDYHSVKTSDRSPMRGILRYWLDFADFTARRAGWGSIWAAARGKQGEEEATVYTLRADDHIHGIVTTAETQVALVLRLFALTPAGKLHFLLSALSFSV